MSIWESKLAHYFNTLLEGEIRVNNIILTKIESIRLELSQTRGFSPSSLFNYLDIDNKDFLSLSDLKAFLL